MQFEYISKEDFPEDTKFERVLNFNFSTNMLFRCTKRKYAMEFINGKIRFNQSKYWIEEENNGNKGIGDNLEGIFLITDKGDNHEFIKSLKKNENLEFLIKEEKIFFRRKSIKDLYCFCLYGLNDNSFNERTVDRFGKEHYISRVEKSYFSDFSYGIKKEEYKIGNYNEMPSIVFIKNPHEFFIKIKEFFKKIGIEEKNIIISPVEYIDYKKDILSLIPYPHELLLKDKFYKKQSEIRIIINSKSEKLIKYMEENNNVIDIGNLSNIADIYDYYFDDLILEKEGNSVAFNLPFPQDIPLEKLTLRELLCIFVQTSNDKLPKEISIKEKKEIISYIKELILKKYDLILSVEDYQIKISNLQCSLEELLDK